LGRLKRGMYILLQPIGAVCKALKIKSLNQNKAWFKVYVLALSYARIMI
jgi:hypothetical protein